MVGGVTWTVVRDRRVHHAGRRRRVPGLERVKKPPVCLSAPRPRGSGQQPLRRDRSLSVAVRFVAAFLQSTAVVPSQRCSTEAIVVGFLIEPAFDGFPNGVSVYRPSPRPTPSYSAESWATTRSRHRSNQALVASVTSSPRQISRSRAPNRRRSDARLRRTFRKYRRPCAGRSSVRPRPTRGRIVRSPWAFLEQAPG